MKKGFIFFILLIWSVLSHAQVAEYFFAQPAGTYAALSEETVLWSSTFDNDTATINIPAFTINGDAYTRMTISSNGFVTFGGTAPGTTIYSPISSSTAYHTAVAPFGVRLQNAASGTPKISYNTNVGGEIVVQWQDVKRQAWSGNEVVNFQLRLNPVDGNIKIIYGNCSTDYTSTSYTVQVGIRGNSNSDFNNRTTTTNWAATTAGTSSSATCRFTVAVFPSSGLTFTWKPLYNPIDFSATSINLSQIDLSWQKNSLDHLVMLAFNTSSTFGVPESGVTYSPGNTIAGGGTVLFYGDGTSFSHTGLSAGTQYFYKIWSFDAVPDYSTGTTTNNRTAFALTYLQDFNTTSLPAEWTTDMASLASHGTAGSRGLAKRMYSSATSGFAISPLVGSVTANTYLSFHYRIVDDSGYPATATTPGPNDKIEVQVSLDDGATFSTFHTIDQGNHATTTEFTNKVLSLGSYSGSFVKVRFLSTWNSGDYYVDIDNVLFEDGTNMSYTGATTEQPNTTNVAINSTHNDIIRLQVITQKSSNPLSLTSINFNTTGSTNAANDLAVARVYYTLSPSFSTETQFGSTFNNPSGTFSITGSQELAQGNNYFWLAYDLRSTATAGNIVDAQCTQFVISDSPSNKSPLVTIPSGSRKIGEAISGVKTIPGDYTTIAAAVTALNNGVVGSGGVTFNVAGDHTETITAPIVLTATGTADNPIVFQKSGSGANPLVTHTGAGSVSTSTIGNHGDGVIIIEGSDYVTFDAVDVAASDQGVEYGYYLRKASFTNGCKYVTIKNAAVTMTKGTSRFVAGICAGNNSATSSNISITTPGGRHENITITGNTVSNVFSGIFLKGSATFNDENFMIGSIGNGNVIRNFGGNNTSETYGIYLISNHNSLVQYNTVDNISGGGTAFTGAANGIRHASMEEVSFTAEHNAINLTTISYQMYGIYATAAGEVQLNHNTISLTHQSSSTSLCAFIYSTASLSSTSSVSISNNTFGASTLLTTNTTYLIYLSNPRISPSLASIQGNATSGTISRTGASGSFYLYYNPNTTGTGVENISGNNFSNITLAGSSVFQGIYSSTNAGHTQNVYNNVISNITAGTGTTQAINLLVAANRSVYDNHIYGISGGGQINGITLGTGSSPGHVFKNEIHDLSSSTTITTAGRVNGILVESGTELYLYNNFISDLQCPQVSSSDAVRGISITSTQANSGIGVYYNTIYLDAVSTGTNFGTSGIFAQASTTPTTATLDLRNNIIVNQSLPGGASYVAAFRRSNSADQNYAGISNNNIFYAGIPGTNQVIYHNGAQAFQTMEAYRAHIGPSRDSLSFSEDPPFINATTAPYNLRLLDGAVSYCESGASPIIFPIIVSDDFDGATRPSTPDIGADEFSGIPAYVEIPESFSATAINSLEIRLDFTPNTGNDDVVIVYNSTGTFSDPSGAPVTGQPLAGGTVLYTGTSSPVVHGSLPTGTAVYYKAFCYNGMNYSIGLPASATPGVAPPSNLLASVASQTRIDLNWMNNAQDDEVMIAVNDIYNMGTPANGTAYGIGDPITGGGTVIYQGPAGEFAHTGLTQWTQYYYRAWSVDVYDYYSSFITTDAITDSDPVTVFPCVQDFGGTWSHNPAAPQGWNVVDVGGSGYFTWIRSQYLYRTAPAGAQGYGNGAQNDYLISPPLVLPDTALMLSWWDRVSLASNTNNYKVLLSTTDKALTSFTVELGDFTCINTDWEMHTIDLSSYSGQTVYLAFYHYFTAQQYEYFGIDDIIIETSIPGVATLEFPIDDMVTFNNPLLQWQLPQSAVPLLGCKVYLDENPAPVTLVYDGSGSEFQTSGLDYGTAYYWKVVPYNSFGEATNVPVWTFTTVTATQLAESFEEDFFPPVAWSMDYGWNYSTTAYHGNHSARRLTTTTPVKLITPMLSVVSGDRLSFFEGTSTSAYQRIQLYYSADKVSWSALGDPIAVKTGGWEYHVVDLEVLAGGNYYLGFGAYYVTGGSGAYVYLDYVTGPEVVPLIPIAATNPDPPDMDEFIPPDVTLSWDPGQNGGIPSGYKLYLDESTSPSTLVYDGDERYYQPLSLQNNTTYYWQVVPYNNTGDAGSCPVWSFTTVPEGGVQIGRQDLTDYALPMNPYYNYNYSQSIYFQSEIGFSGMRIEKVWYHWNGIESGETYKDWVIYMGHTTKSDFSSTSDWVPASQMTMVFNGEVAIPANDGWVEILLDLPFEYNNTENLVIAIDENTPGYGDNEAAFFESETPTYRSIQFYDDNTNPDPAGPPTADYRCLGIPNIRMLFGDIPTTPLLQVNPASWDFGEVPVNMISGPKVFQIMNNGIGTLTITEVALGGTDAGQFQLTDNNTYPVSLTASQAITVTVNFYPDSEGVKSASLDITDDQVSRTLHQVALSGTGTELYTITYPFTETFEDDSPSRPLWTQIIEAGTSNWIFDTGAGGGNINTAHGGVRNAQFYIGSYDEEVTKLVSPVFDLTVLDDPQLLFWYGQQDWLGDQNELKVYYRTGPVQPWVMIFHDATDISQWTEKILSLPEKSSAYQLAFEGINAYGYGNVLDDITVRQTPPPVTVWIGGTSGDWDDPANWSDGVPGATHAVVIAAGDFIPVVDGSVTIFSLTVEAGADITVASTGSLTILGD